MADLAFSQSERRSYLAPMLVAVAAIALAAGIAVHFFPATSVDITSVKTDIVPTHVVFQNGSAGGATIVGHEQAEDTLYVLAQVRIDNKLKTVIYVNDFSITFTNPDGAELTARGVEKRDLPDLFTAFPALKPLASAPLFRDTAIEAGQSASGMILVPLRLKKTDWETRKSAILKVDLYHQNPLFLTLPDGVMAETVKP